MDIKISQSEQSFLREINYDESNFLDWNWL